MKGSVKSITPDFITKTELAAHFCCDMATIDRWIEDSAIPPPHARLSDRYVVWRRAHYQEFVKKGTWPAEAYPRLAT
jgi:predicted DNA-binding transcriptional regulator AlpA